MCMFCSSGMVPGIEVPLGKESIYFPCKKDLEHLGVVHPTKSVRTSRPEREHAWRDFLKIASTTLMTGERLRLVWNQKVLSAVFWTPWAVVPSVTLIEEMEKTIRTAL